jgi:hypothetical protein
MPFINFNEVGVTGENLDDFLVALEKFAKKRGRKAADAWLFNLNPLAQDHRDMEMHFTGDGYTRRHASALVRGEYSHAPLPVRCENPECEGIAWYKSTFGAHKCLRCGALALEAEFIYLDDLLENHASNA